MSHLFQHRRCVVHTHKPRQIIFVCENGRSSAMPRLSKIERERAIGMVMTGTSKMDVARIFRCSRVTINELWHRYQQTGYTDDRPRPGHPRLTTPAEDRRILLTHLRNRLQTATSTCQALFRGRIAAQTVQESLTRT